jgi:hypothetical protein
MNNSQLIENYDSLSLNRLPDILKKNGFTYRLVKRNKERFIYSQHNELGEIVSYEVFLNKIKPWRKMKEMFAKRQNSNMDYSKESEFYETFPKDEEFGSRAWTYPTLEKAMLAFEAK